MFVDPMSETVDNSTADYDLLWSVLPLAAGSHLERCPPGENSESTASILFLDQVRCRKLVARVTTTNLFGDEEMDPLAVVRGDRKSAREGKRKKKTSFCKLIILMVSAHCALSTH